MRQGPLQIPLYRNPLLTLALVVLLYGVMLQMVLRVPVPGARGVMIDFDAFYVASQMIRAGAAGEVYDLAAYTARQTAVSGKDMFMPWAYPPQFDLVVAPLSLLPRDLAYGLFTGLSLTAYLLILQRLAGSLLPMVLVALMPGLVVAVITGQNGLMIAALSGAVALLRLRSSDGVAPGLVLGLMVIKPHLGLGTGVALLLSGAWRSLAAATAVALASCLLVTLVFGPEIWQDFLQAVRLAGANMQAGLYPLFRMTSLYALLFTAGFPAGTAAALQLGFSALVLVVLIAAARQRWPLHRFLALAIMSSFALTPYTYDYDVALTGVALALIANDIRDHAGWRLQVMLATGAWIAGGAGIATLMLFDTPDTDYAPRIWLALGGAGYLLLLSALGLWLFRLARPAVRIRAVPGQPAAQT